MSNWFNRSHLLAGNILTKNHSKFKKIHRTYLSSFLSTSKKEKNIFYYYNLSSLTGQVILRFTIY